MLKLAKLEKKILRQRENRNHFITMDIIKQASFIGIESLTVSNMIKNHRLADALSDAAIGDVLQKIKYKAEWSKIVCQPIDRWTPSSKECSNCGYKKEDLTLKIREWTCPICRIKHDRDINAAKNILKYALEIK